MNKKQIKERDKKKEINEVIIFLLKDLEADIKSKFQIPSTQKNLDSGEVADDGTVKPGHVPHMTDSTILVNEKERRNEKIFGDE
jgi:hypothetical protein